MLEPLLIKKELLGVNYSIGDYYDVIRIVQSHIKEAKSLSVCFTPVHGVMTSAEDNELRSALNKSDLVMPDGQPIRWALNALHKEKLHDRVYGPELTKKLLSSFSELNRARIFLYGGATEHTLSSFENYILKNHQYTDVVGSYREPDINKQTLTLDKIIDCNPNLILVGTGCPKQEKWIVNNTDMLKCPALGVGAAFSLLSGNLEMAPKWMQDSGLEWLYRIIKEPTRLWRRYFYTNSKFILELAKLLFSKLYKKIMPWLDS